MKVEYRVREIKRYIVTRHEDNGGVVGSNREVGSHYDNADTAYEVAYALCKAEHERLGYPLDDMRIIYPEHPVGVTEGMAAGLLAGRAA
jgi:hypothetical protein